MADLQDAARNSVQHDVEKPEEWMVGLHPGCVFLASCSEKYAHTGCTPEHLLVVIYDNRGNASFPYSGLSSSIRFIC
jgi:hypothetical protein